MKIVNKENRSPVLSPKGFTLLEVLLAIVCIGTLAAIIAL
jgi:prepilin-type N-terminal cleavage/methylation domain-containing protein